MNKVHIIDENLHEIKQEILVEYGGEYEKLEKIPNGDQTRKTFIKFRHITDYEAYINAIDHVYESEGAIFIICVYELNTHQFNLVKRSQYRNVCNFKQQIIEYRGKNC